MTNGPLYAMGGAHPAALDAMQGLATGNRAGKRKQREQQIYTPWEIVDVCLQTWPEGIALDPCSGPDSIVPAQERWQGHRIDTGRRDKDGEPVYAWDGPGLVSPWKHRTYVNMPYEDLEAWLDKSEQTYNAHRYMRRFSEQILLFPVRPNRVWWCDYLTSIPDAVAWLKPLLFRGFEQAFPAPLVLTYTGEHVARFQAAAKPLATHVGGRLV